MKTIRIDVAVPKTAEKVWAAIADPDQRRAWFGGVYDIDPFEGGSVRVDLPEDGLHAEGILRAYGPPHMLEHTFVANSLPGIESVCRWSVTRTIDGSLLTFEQVGMSSAQHDQLAPMWSRLLGAPLPEVSGQRLRTSLQGASAVLRGARRVLLVSFIDEEVPRALLQAGLGVLVKSGPGPDQWSLARLDGDALVFDARTAPEPVDIVHLDVDTLFDEYLDVAVRLGASVYWVHSARTRPPTPHDTRGTWLPDDVSIIQREAVEARGLIYIDDVYIADAARA
ncbi:MAG: SRPBCC domain-containing protein [Acidimicrobiales bacterium]